MNTTKKTASFRRSLGLALAAAGSLAFAGCAESSHGNPSVSGNIAGNQVGGPDRTGGLGGLNEVRIVSGTAVGPADDFAIGNSSIVAAIDAVGVDQATLANPVITSKLFLRNGQPGGAQIQTIIAPSGGNLIDLANRGGNNDQFTVGGQGFLGIVGFTTDFAPILNNPLNNLVINFEVIPDTDPRVGIAPDARRLVVLGAVLGSSGTTNPVSGQPIAPPENFLAAASPTSTAVTHQTTAGAIKSSFLALGAALPADFQLPQTFLDNIPDSFSLVTVTNTALGLQVPILVTTVYTVKQGTNYLQVASVVSNAGSSPVAFAGLVDLFQTGAFEKNIDVLVPAPLFTTRDVHFDTSTVPNDPTTTANWTGAPTGVAPWATMQGRDEPGVSYTEFDPNAGQVGVQRPALAFFGVIQPGVSSLAAIDSNGNPGEDQWLRDLAVGSADSAASSSDIAVTILANSPVRVNPANGQPLPNPIVSTCILSGQVTGAGPEGGVVTIDETSPAAFFTGPTATPANKFVSVGPIRRTVARYGADGKWQCTVPGLYHFDAAFTLSATAVNVPATYLVTAAATGAQNSAGPSTSVVASASNVVVPALSVAAEVSTFQFRVVDDTLNVVTPAKLTFKGASSDPDLSIPTGMLQLTRKVRLVPTAPSNAPIPVAPSVTIPNAEASIVDPAEGLDRAEIAGSGNVFYTLTGEGTIQVPPGSYDVIVTLGPEYTATHTAVTLPLAGLTEFHVSRAFTAANARSGDFHVHSGPSPDSSVSFAHRLVAAVADGLEIVTATDHNNLNGVNDGFDAIASQRADVASRLNVFTGVEATVFIKEPGLFTEGLGHYNAFPLAFDASKRKNNAPDVEFRTPSILFSQLRALAPTGSANIIELNHPRSRIGRLPLAGAGFLHNLSYNVAPTTATHTANALAQAATDFPSAQVDPAAGLDGRSALFSLFAVLQADFRGQAEFDPGAPTGARSLNAPAIDLMNKGSLLALLGGTPAAALAPLGTLVTGSLDFDTMEVLNGTEMQTPQLYLDARLDWFNLLNFGIIRTACANTDSHRIGDRPDVTGVNSIVALGGEPLNKDNFGYPRNYLLFPSGAPAAGSVQSIDLVDSLGRAFTDDANWHMSPTGTNPPLEPAITPLTKNANGGRVVCTTGPFLAVTVTGTSASAMPVSGGIGDLINLTGTAFTVNVHVQAAPWVPVDEIRVIIDGVAVTTLTGTAVVAAELLPTGVPVTLPFAALQAAGLHVNRDFWIVVEAGQSLAAIKAGTPPTNVPGQPKYTQIVPNGFVTSFTNPIFVDVNNDGKFRAPADHAVTNP
jgi:hypothetical protein